VTEKEQRRLELKGKAAISAGCAFAYGRVCLTVCRAGPAAPANPPAAAHCSLDRRGGSRSVQPATACRASFERRIYFSTSKSPGAAGAPCCFPRAKSSSTTQDLDPCLPRVLPTLGTTLRLKKKRFEKPSLRKYCSDAAELASMDSRQGAGQQLG
jgi:hypothetical protein